MRHYVPVIHPAATFRSPASLGPLIAHVEGFLGRALGGATPAPKIYVEPPAGTLAKLLKEHEGHPLSVDVETGRFGLMPGFAELRAIGIGWATGDGVGCSWAWPLKADILRLLKDALRTRELLFMNGLSYDMPILRRYGFEMEGPVNDIRDLRHSLSSTSRTRLATQASFYLKIANWKALESNDEDDEKGHVSESTPIKQLLPYNAEDCVRAAQVYVHLRRDQAGDDAARTERIYRQQLRLSEVGSEMSRRGFPFDRDRQRELDRQLLEIHDRESANLKGLLGNVASAFRITNTGGVNESDLAALLYRQCAKKTIKGFNLEVPLAEQCWTETGKPAVNKRALLYLYSLESTPNEARAIIKQCWKVDSPLKARSTYVVSDKVENAIGPDGRMHPKVNTCGPETYRWSCSSPNLFNLPKEVEEKDTDLRGVLPSMRSLYVAPPGYIIVSADFKQLELEVMAEYTGDVLLRQMLDAGDVHSARVRQWFKLPATAPIPGLLRRQAKNVGFASQYAAEAHTVYLTILEKMQDAKYDDIYNLWLLFRQTHTGITKHWDHSREFASQFGYSEAPIMGYRRYYPPGAPIKPQETSNYAIQAGAAAIANSTMVGSDVADMDRGFFYRLRREYPHAWIAMHVYDSFDTICREQDAKGVQQLVQECMAGPWTVGQLPKKYASDCKTGTRWSEV